jgi:hypothetical protein
MRFINLELTGGALLFKKFRKHEKSNIPRFIHCHIYIDRCFLWEEGQPNT